MQMHPVKFAQHGNNMFGPNVPTIDVTDVKEALDRHENVILLDVRTAEEVTKTRIAGSITIPVDDLESKVIQEILDKNQTIYVYCLSGSRSAIAVDKLIKMGYSSVFSIKSGLLAWRAMKYPLET